MDHPTKTSAAVAPAPRSDPENIAADKPRPAGPMAKRLGSFKRLVIVGLAIANLFVAATASVSIWSAYYQAAERSASIAHTMLHSFINLVDLRVERIQSTETLLAEELELQAKLGAPNSALIERVIARAASDPSLSFIIKITDADGVALHGDGSLDTPAATYGDRAYFKTLKARPETKFLMSGILFGKQNKKNIIAFCMPYFTPHGAFAGIVTASMALDSLREVAIPPAIDDDDEDVGFGDEVFILRDLRDMAVLAARYPNMDYDPSKIPEAIAPEPELLAKLATGARSSVIVSNASSSGMQDDPSHALAYGVSTRAPLLMSVGVPRKTPFSGWSASAYRALAFCLFFLGLSGWSARALLARDKRAREAEKENVQLNASLESQVDARTTDLNDALANLRRTHDELAEAERLASLGSMVAGIAHELNTPLGNALVCSSTIEDRAVELLKTLSGPAPKAIRKSEIIREIDSISKLSAMQNSEIARAADLVRSFKQVAVDQASSRRRSFDLQETLQSIAATFGPSLARSSMMISLAIDSKPGILCQTHPGALIQIVSNLLQNAMRHAFDGSRPGHILLLGKAEIRNGVECARVECLDDGSGIDPDIMDKVFDPYFTTKASSDGSGLGLSLSRKLAESSLHGFIWVESNPGGGTRFVLSFPRSLPSPDPSDPA